MDICTYIIFFCTGCVYIYIYWIYTCTPGTWEFIFYFRVYITSKSSTRTERPEFFQSKEASSTGSQANTYKYIYVYMLSLYLELGFHFSILELYGNIKSFILEESNFEHVDFFLFVFSPAIVGDFFNNHFES